MVRSQCATSTGHAVRLAPIYAFYGYYRIVNLSKYSIVKTQAQNLCEFISDTYDLLPLLDEVHGDTPLYPGGERVYKCEEFYARYGWEQSNSDYPPSFKVKIPGWVSVQLSNQIDTTYLEIGRINIPRLDINLSDHVQISLKQLPTENPDLSAIFEVEFTTNSNFPYSIGVYFSEVWWPRTTWPNSGYFWKQNPTDPRLFEEEDPYIFIMPGTKTTKYLLINTDPYDPKPSKICFTLSAPYIAQETVCLAT